MKYYKEIIIVFLLSTAIGCDLIGSDKPEITKYTCNKGCCDIDLTEGEVEVSGTTNAKGDEICLKMKVEPRHWYEWDLEYDEDKETFNYLKMEFYYNNRVLDENGQGNHLNAKITPFLACDSVKEMFLYMKPLVYEDDAELRKLNYMLNFKNSQEVNDGEHYCKNNIGMPPVNKYKGKVGPLRNKNNKINKSWYSFNGIEGNYYKLKFNSFTTDLWLNFGESYSFEENPELKENPVFISSYSDTLSLSDGKSYFSITSESQTPATYEFSIEDLGPEEP